MSLRWLLHKFIVKKQVHALIWLQLCTIISLAFLVVATVV